MEAIAMANPSNDIALSALASLRDRIGGDIVEQKLVPIGPYLSALRPVEPAFNLERRWHVVQTQPQQEKAVAKELKDARLDAYCPVEPKKVRVNAARHRTVTRPMLVGYVFAGFDVSVDVWQAVPSMRGVVRLLMIEMRPVPIPDHVIEQIRQKEQELAGGRCRRPPPITLKTGTLVRILEPLAFAGLFGNIVAIGHEKHEIGVEIEIFGRKVQLLLPPEQVEPI